MIGNTNNVNIVAEISPPMMTSAKGFCDYEPIPVDNAAGNSPMEAIRAVITTGRVRDFTPL
jgi:hypothetical protein